MSSAAYSDPTELIFEIDDPRITANQFRKGVNAFLDVIGEVVKDISGSARDVRWIMSVSQGSVRLHFKAESASARMPDRKLLYVLDTIQSGFHVIEQSPTRPRHFSDAALTKVRELASVVKSGKKGLESIRILRNGHAERVTTTTLAHVDTIFGTASKDFGSVEGILTGVFRKGVYQVWVYDDVLEKNIICKVAPERLKEILKAFEKRVSVSGLIHYRQGGEIAHIDLEDFQVFPDPHTLPGFDEVFGLLRGLE